jgi:hypothetical protein
MSERGYSDDENDDDLRQRGDSKVKEEGDGKEKRGVINRVNRESTAYHAAMGTSADGLETLFCCARYPDPPSFSNRRMRKSRSNSCSCRSRLKSRRTIVEE